MKICRYCGSANYDSALTCVGCGANVFSYLCANCGTVIQNGLYCPKCGIKVGQQPNTCPKCGKEYFTNACPNCGYSHVYQPNNNNYNNNLQPNVNNTGQDSYNQQSYPNTTEQASYTAPTDKTQTTLKPSTSSKKAKTNTSRKTSKKSSMKNKKFSLGKILLWIFLFPIMLTISVAKSSNLNKKAKVVIIIIAWIIFITLGSIGGSSNTNSTNNGVQSSSAVSSTTVSKPTQTPKPTATPKSVTGIIKFNFYEFNKHVELKEGTKNNNYVSVWMEYGRTLNLDDIIFVSDNPEIATISLSDEKSSLSYVYYTIKAISPGETNVYFSTKDGMNSDKINVKVIPTINAESVIITDAPGTVFLGDEISPQVEIYPANTDDKSIIWTSTNESVVSVVESNSGRYTYKKLKAVGSGTATITATTSNGKSASFDISVDGSKRMMNLSVSRIRLDNNNIGTEWSFRNEVNGENAPTNWLVSIGDTITCRSIYKEDDIQPDVGEATASHYVNEADIQNGFSVPMEIYVCENAGSNAGVCAQFAVTYEFKP